MNPECLLVAAPSVDFHAFTIACQQVLGYSPLRLPTLRRAICRRRNGF